MEDNNLFVPEFSNQYTKEEVDILNMEVTPEIQAVLDQMLLEQAMNEAQKYQPQFNGPDKERELWDNIDLFEGYIRLSKEREKYQEKWELLRYRRNTWWSLFKEEMDWNWMELDLFEIKLNKRLAVVEPTPVQWKKAKEVRSTIYNRCLSVQSKRRTVTYPIYLKAMDATRKCQAFWQSEDGRILNALNAERSAYWEAISQLNVTWDDYNQVLECEINRWMTNGDTEEVDTMEMMATNSWEAMEDLSASHAAEMSQFDRVSNGSGYWNWRTAAGTKLAAQQQFSEEEEAWRKYVDSLD